MVDFDPYWKWLGIPPHEQPANYYRLLGVPMFEPDPQVIAAAADRQAFQLYAQQGGPYAEIAQHLLNELGAARACLLDAQSKGQYDDQLQAMIAHRGERSVAAPPPPPSQFPQNGYPGAMPAMAGGYAPQGPMPGDGGMSGGFGPPPGNYSQHPQAGNYGQAPAPYQGSLERPIPGPGAPMPPTPMPTAPAMPAPMSNMAGPPVPMAAPYAGGGMPMTQGPAQAMPTGQIPRAMPIGGVVAAPAGGVPRAMPAAPSPNLPPAAPARPTAAAAGPPPPRINEVAESNEIDLGPEITTSRRYSGSRSSRTKHAKGGMSKETMTLSIVLGGAAALLGLFLLSMMFDSGEKSGYEGAVERSMQRPAVSTTKKKTTAAHTDKAHPDKPDATAKAKSRPQPRPAPIARPNVNRRDLPPQDSVDAAIASPTPYQSEPLPNRSDDLAPLIRPGDIIVPESQLAPPANPAPAPAVEGGDINDAIRGGMQ